MGAVRFSVSVVVVAAAAVRIAALEVASKGYNLVAAITDAVPSCSALSRWGYLNGGATCNNKSAKSLAGDIIQFRHGVTPYQSAVFRGGGRLQSAAVSPL
jgi:hypothetical protein